MDDAEQETLNPDDPTNQQAVTLTPQDPLILSVPKLESTDRSRP
jgi:hypothetical protein